MNWLPIETAPTDGKNVLLAAPYYKAAFIGYFNHPAKSWLNNAHLKEKEQPLHWMPLPEAP